MDSSVRSVGQSGLCSVYSPVQGTGQPVWGVSGLYSVVQDTPGQPMDFEGQESGQPR